MSYLHRLAAITMLLSLAGAAGADDKSKNKDEGRICTLETVVGSHMPKRICTTAAEREATRQGAQDRMNGMQDFANHRAISGSGR